MLSFLSPSRARLSLGLGVLLLPIAMLLPQEKAKHESLPKTIQPPVSQYAQHDAVEKGEYRPIVNVAADGTITAGDKKLFDPESRDDFSTLDRWLTGVRKKMQLEKTPVGGGKSLEMPADKLLIRADLAAPFRCNQKIMERCGRQSLSIWKLQLAVIPGTDVKPPPKGLRTVAAGRIDAYLPIDIGLLQDSESIEVMVQVIKMGKKVQRKNGKPWTKDSDELWSYGADRVVEYSIGPRRMRDFRVFEERLTALLKLREGCRVVIDARRGVTVGEVIQVLDAARKAGGKRISYVGSYE